MYELIITEIVLISAKMRIDQGERKEDSELNESPQNRH